MKFGELQHKTVSFQVTECKQTERNGVPVGIFEGLASTFEEDRGADVIQRGAFIETIKEHQVNNRQIRMLRQHNDMELIGGFPIEFVKETEEGLFVKGEINLTPGSPGEFAFSLMKQGVLMDMSIGFSITSIDDIERREIDGRIIRFIKRVKLWEISLVNEPMNTGAQVMNVKTVTPFEDLPLASRDRPWDSGQAQARVRAFTDSEEQASARYKEAFFWYDEANAEEFGSYKLPFVDVIDGRLMAVPRGVFAAAAAMRGARGGVDIPEEDRPGVRGHIERYYQKMDLPSPFTQQNGVDSSMIEICETARDVEECLKFADISAKGAKKLISIIKELDIRDEYFDSNDEKDADRDDDVSLEAILSKADDVITTHHEHSIKRKIESI